MLATSARASSRGPDRVGLTLAARSRGKRRGGRARSAGGVKPVQFIGNDLSPWPLRLFCKLPYEVGMNMTDPAGPNGTVYYTFKMNDIWDPDPALGGSSCCWFGSMGHLYQYWRVHACTFEGDYTGNTNNTNQYCAVWPSANSTYVGSYAPVDVAGLKSFPDAKYKIIMAEDSLGPTSTVHVNYHCNIAEHYGLDIAGSSVGEGAYGSAPGGGASPGSTETFYWITGVFSTTGTAVVANVFAAFKLLYYVESFQLEKPDNMTLTDLEQLRIDSKGHVQLTPFDEAAPPPDPSPAYPAGDCFTDPVFVAALKAKLSK